MQLAVAGLVALAADFMQPREQWSELVEILQARHVLFPHVIAAFASHAGNDARLTKMRNTTCRGAANAQIPYRTGLGRVRYWQRPKRGRDMNQYWSFRNFDISPNWHEWFVSPSLPGITLTGITRKPLGRPDVGGTCKPRKNRL